MYGPEHGLARELSPLAQEFSRTMFISHGNRMKISPNLFNLNQFELANVLEPDFCGGEQFDVVFGQDFMIHMGADQEDMAFKNLVASVRPGGALFVGGMHLARRPMLARKNHLTPIEWHLEKIHDGDQMRREIWPWYYWSLEPINRKAKDYPFRYATIFQKSTG